jgi:sigma-E factor negative regulatory protein RseA
MSDSDQDFSRSNDARRRLLSSAMDGELANGATAPIAKQWNESVVARQAWHEYHLIGDVLRNDELARTATSDEAFLLALRAKLALEPSVLAPSTPAAAAAFEPSDARWWRWAAPAAVAAGFMAVASILIVSKLSSPASESPEMALAPGGAVTIGVASAATSTLGPDGAGIVVRRDEALDVYLRAHRESISGSPSSWSGASVRATRAALVQSK